MDQQHFTDEQLQNALGRYRTALIDARESLEDDAHRDNVIKAAREILDEDDLDAHRLIQMLASGEAGDPVWNLEEEILDED